VTGQAESPIDRYLDQLFVELSATRPRDARHLLAETEAHLRDAAAEEVSGGLDETDAEAAAVSRFGPSTLMVRAELRRQRPPLRTIALATVASGWFLGALGAIAVGMSGIAAAGLRLVGGATFIADTRPTGVLRASDCSRWLSAAPAARSCHQAAVTDWANETVAYRIALGVLGVGALTLLIVVRKRWTRAGRWTTLPATVVDTIAVMAFGASGVWLAGLGLDAVVVASGHGAGQWLSAAPIALAAALVFGVRLLRDLREDAPSPSLASG
jgi:hypothetical protein